MAGREVIKNIKPVFCRFDMDNDQERRAWQIIQKLSKGQEKGKKQKYNSIIAKALVEYYDRADEMPYPFPYPYPYPAVMSAQSPVPAQQQQEEIQTKTEELNETALSFMDGLMGI